MKIDKKEKFSWKEPEDPSNAEHLQASDDALMFDIGWFAQVPINLCLFIFVFVFVIVFLYLSLYLQPILASDYPPVMREKIDAKSAAQGFPESRYFSISPLPLHCNCPITTYPLCDGAYPLPLPTSHAEFHSSLQSTPPSLTSSSPSLLLGFPHSLRRNYQ